MTVPSKSSLVVMIGVAVLLLVAVVVPGLLWVALAIDAVIVLLCLLEGQQLKRLTITVERRWPKRVQINRETSFEFVIENRSPKTIEVLLRQPWPESIQSKTNRQRVIVGAGEEVVLAMTATPIKRGHIECLPLEVDMGTRVGWSRRRWSVQEGGEMAVYPDLHALAEYDMLKRSRALQQMGIHRQRTIGVGREFEQLREYLPDDDYRDINWKATARRCKPITNIFQVERSRDVMLCLDHGRMMGNPIGTGTALDYAIDAAIMLAHISNRHGDRTGLAVFGDSVDLLLKPRSGRGGPTAIIDRLVDLVSEPVFPSYANLAQALRTRQNHRSLVFIFTDLNDPQLVQDLADVMPLLSSRHMVVVVSLRDALIDKVAQGPVPDRRRLYEQLAARELAQERDASRRELIKAGVEVLEADAEQLTVGAINAYLTIKQRQVL